VQFNVSQLLRESIGSRRRYVVDEPFAPQDDDPSEVRGTGPVYLLRTDSGILATVALESEASGQCDRCLKSVTYPVHMVIEEEFIPTIDPVTGGALPPPDEPGAFTIDDHHILDLTDAARQAWLLAAPMQTLCREDCAGLCPECGSDRNNGACACEEPAVDARWAALASLRGMSLNGEKES
jgi:uncharacterized protein